MPQVTGIAYVSINGKKQRSKEGAKLNPGGMERTAVTGHSVYGYTEKVVPAAVELTLSHMADTDIVELGAIVDATVVFETDTGDSYLVANAFTTKPAELTAGEGDVALEMQGDPAVRQ